MGAKPPNATANNVFILFYQTERGSYFSINLTQKIRPLYPPW